MAKENRALIPALNFSMPGEAEYPVDPNTWFAESFPDATRKYGPAFLEGWWLDENLDRRVQPAFVNIDFMAGMLGGDKRLGHQVVYSRQDDTFSFYDPMVDAFCPTSEEKLQALLSNYLIRCSQACGRLVDIRPLVVTFREKKVLRDVTERAKALLQCDGAFFTGENGHRRFVDGRYIEPTDEPSYRQFVQRTLVASPEGKLTVSDAFHRYYQYCSDNQLQPLTRQEFKHLVTEVIREEFNLGLRHDVIGPSGKAGHGWVGIDCLPIHKGPPKPCSMIDSETTE